MDSILLIIGKMTLGIDTFIPATPAGIIELIKRYEIDLSGKRLSCSR